MLNDDADRLVEEILNQKGDEEVLAVAWVCCHSFLRFDT